MARRRRYVPSSSTASASNSDTNIVSSDRGKHLYVFLSLFALVFIILAWNYFPKTAFSDFSYEQIVKEARTSSVRNLNGTVLGYVTPWNAKGYNMAKKYRAKFTHISPVWYQLKRDDKGLLLAGKHDVDQGWIADVRMGGSPLIVPRMAIEGWSLESMLVEPQEKRRAIKLILDECKEMLYDGVVLEAWNAWASFRIFESPHLRQKALEFVKELGSALHRVKSANGGRPMQLLFVIPPARGGGLEEFKRSDLDFLKHYVDGFSLMTYDFSSPYSPGPNAPLYWVRSCLQSLLVKSDVHLATKVLMGINFYGNDYVLPRGGGAMLGDQYISLLNQYKPELVWDVINREHYFEYVKDHKKHRVYYPSPMSISLRLEESQASHTGISIWELGQGLEQFFHLL